MKGIKARVLDELILAGLQSGQIVWSSMKSVCTLGYLVFPFTPFAYLKTCFSIGL